jgi:NADPH:quinone reductase-like Zn-dependent oxidoreductase
VELVRSIGADHVIDYTKDDFIQSGLRYDFILDNVANHSLSDLRRALTPTGTLVPNGGNFGNRWFAGGGRVLTALLWSRVAGLRLRPFLVAQKHEDLVVLKEMIESGKVTPVMHRAYPLTETSAAMSHAGSGHARGKTAITVWEGDHALTRVA